MLGKNFASLGVGSDGSHGRQMPVFPFLTMGHLPQERNQGSEVGVNTKQIISDSSTSWSWVPPEANDS